MHVRQKDIAKKMNLSINTVSLALKGSSRISEETRKAVQKVAEELHYIPNNVARSLVQQSTKTVGLILTQIMNPVLTATAQHFEQKLAAKGYAMILMATGFSSENEAKALEVLISRQVDGILMYPTLPCNLNLLNRLKKTDYPIILLTNDGSELPCDAVYMDRFKGAYKATMHLAGLGHRKIAIIDGEARDSRSLENCDSIRLKGYKSALDAVGIDFDRELVVYAGGNNIFKSDVREGYEAAAKLFKNRRPTAIFAIKDELALGAFKWCRDHSLRIPEDVAIVGCDDIEAARLIEVPLTSLAYNVEEIATRATELLFKRMHGEAGEPVQIAIEPELVIRKSSGINL